MKKQIYLVASLVVLLLIACQPRDTFKLIGTVEGLEADKVVALIPLDFNKEKSTEDTLCVAKSTAGAFELTGKMPQESMMAYRLVFEGVQNQRYPVLLLENKDIKIEGTMDDLRNLKISGSALNDEFESMFKVYKEIDGEYERAQSETEKRKALEKMKSAVVDIPTANPNSPMSPLLILLTTGRQRAEFIPIYESFSQEVKDSYYGKVLFDRLPTNFIGTPVADVVLNDRAGNTITLKDQLGKCTIVDFWASWCGPCRRSIPSLKNLYIKYHDQGLNIYSISLDRDSTQWIKALDEEKMEWPNVRDRFDEQSFARHYEVEFIPHFLLIGNDGKVIAVNAEPDEMERLIVEQLTEK